MILVDSSVWIDYFNGADTPGVHALDRLLGNTDVAVGDLMLTEVLQGFRSDSDAETARELLTSLPVVNLVNTTTALQAAHHFRVLRKRGVTVRKTIDVLIATFCILQGTVLLHSDRDFDPFEEHLGLQVLATGS